MSRPEFSALDPLSVIPFLHAKEGVALAAAGFATPYSILRHFPRRYEDRRRFDAFPNQGSATAVCLRGTIIDAAPRHFGPGRKFFEAVVMDGAGGVFGSGKVACRWFNMPFIGKILAANQQVSLYGKVKEQQGRLIMDHPEFEVLRDDGGDSIHMDRVVPIYRSAAGVSQRRWRELAHGLLGGVDPRSIDPPVGAETVGDGLQALRAVHFPESLEDVPTARRQFAREDFLRLQLNVLWRRNRYREQAGLELGRNTTLLKSFYHSLPFDLTGAQKRSIKEIAADMRLPQPMNRLLQGDVGTGKTFVAMAAMLLAVGSQYQTALMAPTQILAEQHYLTFQRWLSPLGIRIALRTGNRDESTHLELDGPPHIVIGTHALIHDSSLFVKLGLVVIDEQHKFGVAQRAALAGQGKLPDVLVMTATPIPRTLAMTVYGDLAVSLLDETPPGRGGMVTGVRISPKLPDVTKFLRSRLEEGRQAYLVYPLVEESASTAAESAITAFGKWVKRLKGFEVGLIHGKLRPEEKDIIMARFRSGEIAALVATTVIEVGVDVPNATVMIIHHAERFGLAQLHQLRGRVGRGVQKGYCILITDGKSPEALEKLKVLERSRDGFEIAEADLKLRGPGDVLGTEQSGLSGIQFTDFLADTGLIQESRALAEEILAQDPCLNGSHRALRAWITEDSMTGDIPGP